MSDCKPYPEDVSELNDLVQYPYKLTEGPNKGKVKYVSGPKGICLADMIQLELESTILSDDNGVWHQYKDGVIIFTFDQGFASSIGRFNELPTKSKGSAEEGYSQRVLDNSETDRELVVDYYRATKKHLQQLTQ